MIRHNKFVLKAVMSLHSSISRLTVLLLLVTSSQQEPAAPTCCTNLLESAPVDKHVEKKGITDGVGG